MKTQRFVMFSALAGLGCAVLCSVLIESSPTVLTDKAEGEQQPVAAKSSSVSPFRESLASRNESKVQKVEAAKGNSNFPLFFKLAKTLDVPFQPTPPAGIDPKTLPAEKRVISTTEVSASSMPDLKSLRQGQMIGIPLPDGSSHDGRVNLVKSKSGKHTRVGGSLIGLENASFSLSQQDGQLFGLIRIPSLKRAYVIQSISDGRVVMQEHSLSEVECLGMKRKDDEPANISDADLKAAALQPQAAIPLIDTLPTATAVIYLDFDGEIVTDPDWHGGSPINAVAPIFNGLPLTETHIRETIAAVAEDFAPYNVTITTSLARYTAAPVGRRMRCIITPTDFDDTGAAGIAYIGSWANAGTSFDDEVPCWCFGMYDPVSMALVISHEVGHTFGLTHDGTTAQPYYGGHTSGVISWGPIMGAPYGRTMTQWSAGGYVNSNNAQDDVAIIGNVVNNVGFLTDEAGGATGTANLTSDTINGAVDLTGLLTTSADEDWFKITSHTGGYSFNVQPIAVQENVDITLQLLDSTGFPVASSSPTANRGASMSGTLTTAGTYYISIRPSGDGVSPAVGYSNYGSLGPYRLSGSFTPVPSTPQIITHPASIAAVDGSTITLSVVAIGSGGLTYQWIKGAGQPVIGATTASLKLTNMTLDKTGDYKVRVRNASNSALETFSNVATVTINYRPKITTQPVSSPVLIAGQPYTFSVAASGTAPLSYTWEKIGKPNNVTVGGDSPTFPIASVQLADAGSYRVKVTNVTGTVLTSSTVTLKVDSPPVFLQQPPASMVIAEGASGIIKTLVGGKAPFTYEWYKVTGMTETKVGTNAANLTVKGDVNGAGTYRLKVTNAISTLLVQSPTVSSDVVVEVDTKPAIVGVALSPLGGTYQAGDNVTMTANVTGSTTGRTFQWFRDNILIPGAIADTLSFTPISWFDRGNYTVQVSNRVGSVKSKPALIKVLSKPVIITQPVSFIGATGGTASFNVVAGGDTPLTYQWYKDNVSMAPLGKTAKLTLSKLVAGTADYFCKVSNGHLGGPVDTNVVTLTVEDAPKVTAITSDHASNKHKLAVAGSITITPTVSGAPPFNFQWYKAGKPIVGALGATLVISPASLTDTGSYHVVVRNRTPVSAKSATVALSVLIPPSITFPPANQSVTEYSAASFSLIAAGSPVLKYQWQKIEDFGSGDVYISLPGKTTSKLSFTSAKPEDSGRYRCLITNDVGSATSTTAVLSVNPTPVSSVTNFLPTQAKIGEKVIVYGTNFDYITKVMLGGKSATFTIISPTELMFTVPSGVTTSPATHVIEIISRAGTFSAGNPFVAYSTPINDAVIDAVILSGSQTQYVGNTTTFTNSDSEDIISYSENSAWHWWTAPTTGSYRFRTGGNFDTILVLYTGRPDTNLTFQQLSNTLYTNAETINRNVTAGQSYMISVSGYQWQNIPYFGNYTLQIQSNSPAASQNFEDAADFSSGEAIVGKGEWEQEGPAAAATVVSVGDGTQGVRLGGIEGLGSTPVVLWNDAQKAPEGTDLVVASVTMKMELPEGGAADRFGWTLHDKEKNPVAALWLDSSDGRLQFTDVGGETSDVGQKLESGSPHHLEFILDQENLTLAITFDGVVLVSGAKVPVGTTFGDLSAVWVPSGLDGDRASMFFDDLTVSFRPGK